MATDATVAGSLICPMCGGENPGDAVFCGDPLCHKALGEFPYVLEELEGQKRWHESLADRFTAFVGRPHFIAVHAAWFLLWVAINTGVVAIVHEFDMAPFGLLGILLGMEAIFMTSFILISQNRQNAHSNKRAELDYEVNVRVYRHVHQEAATLREIVARLERIESRLDA